MIRDFDQLRDIAIQMVNNLVEQGYIPNCTDTDDSTEFDVQDLLLEILIDNLVQQDCVTPNGVASSSVELKEFNEDYRIAFISVDEIPLGIFELFYDKQQEDRPFVLIDYDVTYVDNLI